TSSAADEGDTAGGGERTLLVMTIPSCVSRRGRWGRIGERSICNSGAGDDPGSGGALRICATTTAHKAHGLSEPGVRATGAPHPSPEVCGFGTAPGQDRTPRGDRGGAGSRLPAYTTGERGDFRPGWAPDPGPVRRLRSAGRRCGRVTISSR